MLMTASVMTTGRGPLGGAREQPEAPAQHAERADLVDDADHQHRVDGVADAAASGSQVWNGNSGALMANAAMKPRNSSLSVLAPIVEVRSGR